MSASQSSKLNFPRAARHAVVFTFLLLAIEFLDEFVFGAGEAAWPLIRADLALTYAQIGLLLGVPRLVGNVLEPFIGILGDVWKRRALVLGGGLIFSAALLLTGVAFNFPVLLLSFALFHPGSGAFVSLSQASLMDSDPQREEQLMARWTLAGSLGVVAGPLALGAAMGLGLGWRGLFLVFGALGLGLVFLVWRQTFPKQHAPEAHSLRAGLLNAVRALRRGAVVRWLILLEFSDFMLDMLLSFLALYMVDVARVSPALAGTAVAVWSGVGLLGDALMIPVLEKVRGLTYLRYSAVLILILYPAFLLAPSYALKLGVLACLGFFNAGWYAILKAKLFDSMHGQSAAALTLDNVSGLIGKLLPLGIGLAAQVYGIQTAMWLLLAGPVALLIGLPRKESPLPKGKG